MKHGKSLLCLLLALLLLTGCAPAAQSPAPAETQQTAEPQAAAAEEPAAPEQSAEQQPEQSDTITVTDHNDNVVTVPRRIDRIVVCDILPLPSVLSVFFDSAEKLVGIAPSSMSAAQNSLLSQLYPEILNAETGFMNGTDVNTEELMKLAPDVVFYSAMNPALGEKLQTAGFCAVAVSVNKWEYDCIETLNQWISSMTVEEREGFVNTLFSVLYASGEDTFASMAGNLQTALPAMLDSLAATDPEERRYLMRAVSLLLRAFVPEVSLPEVMLPEVALPESLAALQSEGTALLARARARAESAVGAGATQVAETSGATDDA